jgi:CO dehydrogenase maturation factor
VILDNEAGLENLSRRIVQKVNVLILVSDASNSGIETLGRLYTLSNEMDIKYDKLVIIINRLRSEELPEKVQEIKEFTKADYVVGLPNDDEIAEFAEKNKSMLGLSNDNKVIKLIDKLMNDLMNK